MYVHGFSVGMLGILALYEITAHMHSGIIQTVWNQCFKLNLFWTSAVSTQLASASARYEA